MRCLDCGTNSLRRQRVWGMCPRCRRPFTFEPRSADSLGMTDFGFKRAIDVVSQDGTVRWGIEHLYYELRRRDRRRRRVATWLVPDSVRPSGPLFETWWARWMNMRGEPPGLLPQRLLYERDEPAELPPDVPDYSFDRILVCDRERTADVLLVNRFHVEHRCPVVAATGYPRHVFDTLMEMVRRTSALAVWVLHDADPTGCALPERLTADRRWFSEEVARGDAFVVDTGLRPAQARRFQAELSPGQGAADLAGIDKREMRWLRRHRLEVAAIPPGVLVSRMGRIVSSDPTAVPAGDRPGDPAWRFWGSDDGEGRRSDPADLGEDVG